jgi:hypothetical protein
MRTLFALVPLMALGILAGFSSEETTGRDLEGLASEARLRSFQALAELDGEQLAMLAGLADRVAERRDRYLDRRLSVLEIQRTAFGKFRGENLDGGEFTSLVQKNTEKAERIGNVSSREFVRSLSMIDEIAREELDPGQYLLLEVLDPEDFVHCALGPMARAPGKPLERQAWGALEAVAGLQGLQLTGKARREAERLLEVSAREGAAPWDHEAELIRIRALLERAASLPERAIERCRERLARALLPRTESARARRELRELHLQEHPRPSTLVRLLLVEGAASLLRGGETTDSTARQREVRELEGEVAELRHDINLLNLMNGLHLSRGQLATLRGIGGQAREERAKVAERRPHPSLFASLGFPPAPLEPSGKEGDRTQLGREMKRLRDEIDRGRLPGEKGMRGMERIAGHAPVARPLLPHVCRAELGGEVLEVLSPAQVQVLFDYVSCLIPPEELLNPVRVGEAGNDEEVLDALREVRDIPEERYGEERRAVAEGVLSRLERHEGSWPAGERERVVGEIAELLDEVRDLDDASFTVRSPDFIERVSTLEFKSVLLAKVDIDREHELNRRANVHLLDPRVVDLAGAIITRRDERGLPDPVDLETIRPADSCKDGKCAVD